MRSAASVQPPFTYLLRSCNQSTAPMRLGCLVKDYFPKPVTVTWDPVFVNVSILDFPAISLDSGAWVTTSQVTAWGKLANNFTCRVEHVPSATYKILYVPHSNITQPTLKLLHSSCNPNNFDSTIQLYCFIYGHTPGDIFVTWLKNGQEMPKAFPREFLLKQEGKLAYTYSELNITREEWVSESTFTCQVISQGVIYKAHAQKCPDYEPRGVSTYLIPPSPLDLYVNMAPKLTCLVVDLESENLVTVNWTRESRKPVGQMSWHSTRHYNATISIISTLPVDAKDWTEGEGYRCMVFHPDLPKPIVRSITKAPGQRLEPKVYIYLPPKEEIQKNKNKKLTLTCLIQNFFPADISVQWLQDGVLIPSNQYSTTAPLKDNSSKAAFFIFSRLQVTWKDWMQNNQFTCRVIHEAIPNSRTLEKTVSNNPELDLQDLCAEESESKELEELWTSTYIFITLFLISVSYGATVTLLKVKWIFSALMQDTPQTFHDYINILQPRV